MAARRWLLWLVDGKVEKKKNKKKNQKKEKKNTRRPFLRERWPNDDVKWPIFSFDIKHCSLHFLFRRHFDCRRMSSVSKEMKLQKSGVSWLCFSVGLDSIVFFSFLSFYDSFVFFFLSLNDSKERCGRRWNMNGIKRRVTAIRQCVPRNRKKTLPHRYIPHTLKKKLGKTWLRSAELTLNRLSGLNIGDRGRLFALISKLDVIIGISHSKRNHGCRVDRVSLRRSVGRIPLPAARPKRTRQRDWLRSGSRRRRCSGRCTCGNGCPVFFSNTMMDRLKSSRKIFQFSLFNKVLSSFELVSKLPPLSRFYFFANPEFNWFFAWVVTPDKWIAK